MWKVIDELSRSPKSRRKKVLERALSKRESNLMTVESTASKKDSDRRKALRRDDIQSGTHTLTFKNVHGSNQYSAEMAKQIHHQDILVEIPTKNKAIFIDESDKNPKSRRKNNADLKSDLNGPHDGVTFEHASGSSLLESEWRSKHMERSEKTHELNFVPQSMQRQKVVEKLGESVENFDVDITADTRLEYAQKVKQFSKVKTGKLRMSEIGDPVNFEHVSGSTKVYEKSENELSDDSLWSDDGGITDEDTFGQESNDKMTALVKIEIPERKAHNGKKEMVKRGDLSGPLAVEHVSGFSKLGVSVENFDVGNYAENPEAFTQSVSKEMAITEGNQETITVARTVAVTSF